MKYEIDSNTMNDFDIYIRVENGFLLQLSKQWSSWSRGRASGGAVPRFKLIGTYAELITALNEI